MAAPFLYFILAIAGYQTYQHEQNKLYEFELVLNNGTKIANVYTNTRSLSDWLKGVLKRRDLCNNTSNLILQYYNTRDDRIVVMERGPHQPFSYLFRPC